MELRKILGIDSLLSYHGFSEQFIIHTDNNKTYLGGAIIQNGNPIFFY